MEKLGNKVMSSLDWTVQAFVDARISWEALLQPDGVELILKVWDAKARRIQEDESKLLMQKAVFSVARGKTSLFGNAHQGGWRKSRQAQQLTKPTTTWGTVLKEGARLPKQSEQTRLSTHS